MAWGFQVGPPAVMATVLAYYAANWAVPEWHIDADAGSDSADGSAAHPLQSLDELSARLAMPMAVNHAIMVYVKGSAAVNAGTLRCEWRPASGAATFEVQGVTTELDRRPLVSWLTHTHGNPATPTEGRATQISMAGVDFGTHLVSRLRRVSDSSCAFVAKSNPYALGADVARIGIPTTTTGAAATWAAADDVALEALPKVTSIDVRSAGFNATATCIVRGVELTGELASSGLRRVVFRAGIMAGTWTNGGAFNGSGPVAQLSGSLVLTDNVGIANQSTVANLSNCVVRTRTGAGGTLSIYAGTVSGCVFQAVRLNVAALAPVLIADLQSFDVAGNPALQATQGAAIMFYTGFSGDGNAVALQLAKSTRVHWGAGFIWNMQHAGAGSAVVRFAADSLQGPITPAQVWTAIQDYKDGEARGYALIGVGGSVSPSIPFFVNWTTQEAHVTLSVPVDPAVSKVPYVLDSERIASFTTGVSGITIRGTPGDTVYWSVTPRRQDIRCCPV